MFRESPDTRRQRKDELIDAAKGPEQHNVWAQLKV